MKTKETMQVMTKLEHKETHIMSQYEQGYKTGFEFGKEYTNAKHLIDLMDAKNMLKIYFKKFHVEDLLKLNFKPI